MAWQWTVIVLLANQHWKQSCFIGLGASTCFWTQGTEYDLQLVIQSTQFQLVHGIGTGDYFLPVQLVLQGQGEHLLVKLKTSIRCSSGGSAVPLWKWTVTSLYSIKRNCVQNVHEIEKHIPDFPFPTMALTFVDFKWPSWSNSLTLQSHTRT